jgi:hypothetical protein
VILARHSLPALRTGSFEPLYARDEVVAYLRRHELDNVLVVINNSDSKKTIGLDLNGVFAADTVLQDQLGDSSYLIQAGKPTEISLNAFTALVLA